MNIDPAGPGSIQDRWKRRPLFAVVVPEIGEGVRDIARGRPANAQVRVAPLGCIQLADVEPTQKCDLVVDHQQLAVIARVAARVEDIPDSVERAVFEDIDRGGKALECWRYD